MTDITEPGFDESSEPGPAIESAVHGSAILAMHEVFDALRKPEVIGIKDPLSKTTALVVVTPGGGIHALPASTFDDYLVGPRFRKGTATLFDLNSFVEFTKRFVDDDSVVFANNDRAKPSLTAVLDYHAKGSEGTPRHGRHRAEFAFPLSDEWLAWNGMNGKPMGQAAFAKFLEDHIIDVMGGDEIRLGEAAQRFVNALGGEARIGNPAQLMEMATNFQMVDVQTIGNATRLSSGETKLQFVNEHQAPTGAALVMPSMFVIAIPVFKGEEPYQVLARLRYRPDGGEIKFFYDLWRLDIIFDDAFDGAVQRVIVETGAPVLIGKPETASV